MKLFRSKTKQNKCNNMINDSCSLISELSRLQKEYNFKKENIPECSLRFRDDDKLKPIMDYFFKVKKFDKDFDKTIYQRANDLDRSINYFVTQGMATEPQFTYLTIRYVVDMLQMAGIEIERAKAYNEELNKLDARIREIKTTLNIE